MNKNAYNNQISLDVPIRAILMLIEHVNLDNSKVVWMQTMRTYYKISRFELVIILVLFV